jgi:hypothetical protein
MPATLESCGLCEDEFDLSEPLAVKQSSQGYVHLDDDQLPWVTAGSSQPWARS